MKRKIFMIGICNNYSYGLGNPAGNSVIISGGNGQTVQFDRMKRDLLAGSPVPGGSPLRVLLYKYRAGSGMNS